MKKLAIGLYIFLLASCTLQQANNSNDEAPEQEVAEQQADIDYEVAEVGNDNAFARIIVDELPNEEEIAKIATEMCKQYHRVDICYRNAEERGQEVISIYQDFWLNIATGEVKTY
jgi:Tfp pilus assembly protein FimV